VYANTTARQPTDFQNAGMRGGCHDLRGTEKRLSSSMPRDVFMCVCVCVCDEVRE
jgi:hypothetical protein